MRAQRGRRNGFTIIELLFSSLIFMMSIAAIGSFMTYVLNLEKTSRNSKSVIDVKAELVNMLSNRKAWEAMLLKANTTHPYKSAPLNPEIRCLRDHTNCNEGSYNFTAFDNNGVIIADAVDTAMGFNDRGETCNNFKQDDSDAVTCPFRFELKWEALCPVGQITCINPQVQIKATLLKNQFFPQEINTAIYNLQLYVNNSWVSSPLALQRITKTNATVLNLGTTNIQYDLKNAVFYTSDKSLLSFSVPSATSLKNGTVSVTGSMLSYDPQPGFYGLDKISYSVEDLEGRISTGLIWVRVMTPHTWIGRVGSVNLTTSDLTNFCGVVVSGVCDRATFPAGNIDRHYIFNENCESCDVQLNANALTPTAHSLEIAAAFPGTVTQIASVTVGNPGASLWKKFPIFGQKGGDFKTTGLPMLLTVTSENVGGYIRQLTDRSLKLDGGDFEAPEMLRIIGGSEINTAGRFLHRNGTVEFFPLNYSAALKRFTAPSAVFWNFNFGDPVYTPGFPARYNALLTDSFTVESNFNFYPSGFDDASIGSYGVGPVNNNVVIRILGNINLGRTGGGHCNGGGDCAAPVLELSGTGNQTIVGTVNTGTTAAQVHSQTAYLPYVRINKTAGSVAITGNVGIRAGFEVTPATTVPITTTGSNFVFGDQSYTTTPVIPRYMEFNNLYFLKVGGSLNFSSTNLITIRGNFYYWGSLNANIYGNLRTISPTVLMLDGDLFLGSSQDDIGGTATWVDLKMASALNQRIIGMAPGLGGAMQMDLEIDKAAGTVTLLGEVGILRHFWIKNGAVIQDPASTLVITNSNSYAAKITVPNAFTFENLEIDARLNLGSNINVKNLRIGSRIPNIGSGVWPQIYTPGGGNTISISRNMHIDYDIKFSPPHFLEFTGAADQSVTVKPSSSFGLSGSQVLINKPAGTVNWGGNLTIASLNLQQGILSMTSTFDNLTSIGSQGSQVGTTINKNGATLSAASTQFLGTVNP